MYGMLLRLQNKEFQLQILIWSGVGGHCIPIDPIYLSWLMGKKKYKTKSIEFRQN